MIKIVETKDFASLAKLNEEIQTFHHKIQPKIFKTYDQKAIINFFQITLNNENAVAYVAKENETALGYVLLFKIDFADNP